MNGRPLLLLALLVLGAACSSSPRGDEQPPAQLPPPRLTDDDFEKLGHDAGAALAATTTLSRTLGRGPIGWAHVANLIPWRELRDVNVLGVRYAFEKGSGLATIEGVASYSLAVDVLAFAHRARDGAVRVEYSFDFLLVDDLGGTPWARCVTRELEGGKGEVETQTLSLHDLDALAAQCAQEVARELGALGSSNVFVNPCPRERRPETVLVVAFEDRLRVALLARGITPAGRSNYELDLRVEKRGIAPETGAETHDFNVDLSRAGAAVPFARWHRVRTN